MGCIIHPQTFYTWVPDMIWASLSETAFLVAVLSGNSWGYIIGNYYKILVPDACSVRQSPHDIRGGMML